MSTAMQRAVWAMAARRKRGAVSSSTGVAMPCGATVNRYWVRLPWEGGAEVELSNPDTGGGVSEWCSGTSALYGYVHATDEAFAAAIADRERIRRLAKRLEA